MQKHTYRVTLPDGQVAQVTTKRTYSHGVVLYNTEEQRWGLIAFAGRPDLAEKTVREYSRPCWPSEWTQIHPVPVDNPRDEN